MDPKKFEVELKESGITIVEKAQVEDNFDFGFIKLSESSYDEKSGEVEAILIEAGTNHDKKRHYPRSTIQEAAPHFAGLKMYLNHPTKREEQEQPERDITKWASTIVESRYDDGKAIGRIAIHDPWLRERMKDPVARKHIGLSILTGGRISYGDIGESKRYQIVEEIVFSRQNGPVSVDWVTEAGARGRVSKLLKETNTSTGGKSMDLKEAKLEDIKKENPNLLKDLTESIKKEIQESDEAKKKTEELKETQAENEKLKKEKLLREQKDSVADILKEAKTLPEITKERISKEFAGTLYESEKELKEAIQSRIKEELEYLNKLSEKGKIKTGSQGSKDESLKESLQKDLDTRAGIKEKKEKE
jgi:hypothetical protein